MKFSGSYVALVTPFNADGSVNFDTLRALAKWHLEQARTALSCWARPASRAP